MTEVRINTKSKILTQGKERLLNWRPIKIEKFFINNTYIDDRPMKRSFVKPYNGFIAYYDEEKVSQKEAVKRLVSMELRILKRDIFVKQGHLTQMSELLTK